MAKSGKSNYSAAGKLDLLDQKSIKVYVVWIALTNYPWVPAPPGRAYNTLFTTYLSGDNLRDWPRIGMPVEFL